MQASIHEPALAHLLDARANGLAAHATCVPRGKSRLGTARGVFAIYHLGQVLSKNFRLLRVSYTVFTIGLAAGAILSVAVLVVGAVTQPPSSILP